jgi:hypothetical protein
MIVFIRIESGHQLCLLLLLAPATSRLVSIKFQKKTRTKKRTRIDASTRVHQINSCAASCHYEQLLYPNVILIGALVNETLVMHLRATA